MRRYVAVGLLLAASSGCMNLDTGPETGGTRPLRAQGAVPLSVPGVQGPYGTPVPLAAPYSAAPPGSMWAAQQMMSRSVPLNMVQMNNTAGPTGGAPGGMILSPPGMPFAPGAPSGGSVNPTNSQPIMPGAGPTSANGTPGDILQAQFALNPATAGSHSSGQRTQVRFLRPVAMQVSWFTQGPDGKPMYSPTPIEAPGKYNFLQGSRYRLKLTNLAGRPGVELYPTLEVAAGNHKTEAFLAHSSVPVEFTDEDFKQAAEGNYVVKVIYLPDPNFQDVAGTGTDEILSTRLEPGQDPIQEALRRGSILLVIRMGNIDQEAPNTPPLGAQGPAGVPPGFAPPMKFGPTTPGVAPAPLQVPYWGMGPHGPIPPGAVPPGMMPPGMVPPSLAPHGNVPPGFVPPPGTPGGPFVPGPGGRGAVSPVTPAPLVPAPLVPPAGRSPIAPPLPGFDASSKAPQASDGNKALSLPTTPVTPVSVPPAVEATAPGLPSLPAANAGGAVAPALPSLPPPAPMALPK